MGNKQVDLIVIAEPLNPGTKKKTCDTGYNGMGDD